MKSYASSLEKVNRFPLIPLLLILDSVTFVPLTETTKEVQAIKTGSVAAIYPQPANENVPQLTNQSGITTKFGVNGQYENIWFNEKEGRPFHDKNVRGAVSSFVGFGGQGRQGGQERHTQQLAPLTVIRHPT